MFDTIDESPRIDSSLGRIDTEDLIKVSMDAYDHHKYNIDIEFEDIVPFKPEVVPQPEETAPQNSNLNRLINISDCTLHIAMNYRGQRVFDRVCTGPEGCHIFYNSCRGDTAHSNAMDKGLTLQMKSGSIYAIRRGRCRIYVSTPSWNNGGLLRLDRDVETNIFDVDNYFKPALTKYMHQKGPMPLVEMGIRQNSVKGPVYRKTRRVTTSYVGV
ncbi:uncharacterized protein LOC127844232 isoform X2 [Dreissena polymorpha]|uniref:uncharacterized protein LOC127844232 isoform X2 n=1 Tax=Dreissena polymorpha TaxID=45954 RepID=UPI002264EDDF|nr:uncharacterized protein LOC127844232 isoform X2 [Dreissena polymorpha]